MECKRWKARDIGAAVAQATGDAPAEMVPAVFYRLDRDQWRVDLPASELLRLKALERDTQLREAA